MFWNRTSATTAPDDPYTPLPTTKNRRRSEPPAAFILLDEPRRHARRQSVVPCRSDAEWREELDVRGVGLCRGMQKQRSRSVGEVGQERRLEEEEEERSVRFQGMPSGVGIGMGRQRSRSAGEVMRQGPSLQPYSHRQIMDHSGFESEPGAGAGAGDSVGIGIRERSTGLGRQRSRSGVKSIHSPLYPHHQPRLEGLKHHERRCIQYVHPSSDVGARSNQQYDEERPPVGMVVKMGRQQSQSAGADMGTHPYPPQYPHTRPLALVDKHFRGRSKESASSYPPPPTSAQQQYRPQNETQCRGSQLQFHPRRDNEPPVQRSILQVHDRELVPDIISHQAPTTNQVPYPLPPGSSPNPRARTANLFAPALPSSQSRSRIPIPHSQGRQIERCDQPRGAGIDVGIDAIHGLVGAHGPMSSPDRNINATDTRPKGDKAHLHLPNPHPHDVENDTVVLMPSDGLFDMECFSLLSAPSSSSRSSPAPGPISAMVRGGAGAPHMKHRSSSASQVVLGSSDNVNLGLRPSGSQADMTSVCSDSAPALEERLMDVSFPSEIISSTLFAGVSNSKTSTSTTAAPSRSSTASTKNLSSRSSSRSSTSNTSTSAQILDLQQRQHIRALELELERSETVMAEALGETFRAREREAAWKLRVSELEAMLGVGAAGGPEGAVGAAVRGVNSGVMVEANPGSAVLELQEKMCVVVSERDEALKQLMEVRKVMCVSGAIAAAAC